MSELQEHFDRGVLLLQQRKFLEAEPFFENVLKLEPNRTTALRLLGTVCRETGRPERAVELIQKALEQNPQSSAAYRDLALAQLDLDHPFNALASCDRAISIDRTDADTHRIRGLALLQLNLVQNALASLDAAIALEPTLARAHHARAVALLRLGLADEALDGCDSALALDPDLAEAHGTAGTAHMARRRFTDALARYDAGLSLDPSLAAVQWNKGLCLLQMGRLEEGFRAYEWRKRLRRPIGCRSCPQPLWSGEDDIAGKTLFIYWEQGLGDTIQFYRYAKLAAARGARVVVSVQDALVTLLQHSDPDIQILHSAETPTDFDYHSPILSLPFAFRTTLATIPANCPYIAPNRGLRFAWSHRLQTTTRPRAGIVWSGATRHANDRSRSISLQQLFPLIGEDVDWICLQPDLTGKDIGLLREFGRVRYFGDEIKDFSDTAALIDLMDLVITVDTSVAHLAGAMGKPVWIMLPYESDWRWLLDRNDSPWYPDARLYRQQDPGDWGSVIRRLRHDLRSAQTTRS